MGFELLDKFPNKVKDYEEEVTTTLRAAGVSQEGIKEAVERGKRFAVGVSQGQALRFGVSAENLFDDWIEIAKDQVIGFARAFIPTIPRRKKLKEVV